MPARTRLDLLIVSLSGVLNLTVQPFSSASISARKAGAMSGRANA